MEKILTATQSVGIPFSCNVSFLVFLDTYADGWHIEYAQDHDSVTDKTTLKLEKVA